MILSIKEHNLVKNLFRLYQYYLINLKLEIKKKLLVFNVHQNVKI